MSTQFSEVNDLILSLSEEDFSSMSFEEINKLLWSLYSRYYEEKPVNIETFIKDSYFLGDFFPDDSFYPYWMEQMKRIHASPFLNTCDEIICLLPLGAGKTLTAMVSVAYEVYKLLLLKQPQSFYNLRPQSVKIVFAILSASMVVSEETSWVYLSSFLEAPCFKELGVFLKFRSIRNNSVIDLPKNISVTVGSSFRQTLGTALIGAVLDEANFRKGKTEAHDSYRAMVRRRESRYLEKGGYLPGIFWLLSSPAYDSGFVEERLDSIETSRIKKIFSVPIYEIKRHMGIYSKECFYVFVGDKTRDPCIISEANLVNYPFDRIYKVPIDFYEAFKSDLVSGIADHLGVPITREVSYISMPQQISKCQVLPSRFSKSVIEYDLREVQSRMHIPLEDYVDKSYFENPSHSQVSRHIHMDPGLSQDRFCIASCYVSPRANGSDLLYILPWCFVVQAIKGQEVPFYVIEEFFKFLRRIKYPVSLVTSDSFQSRQLLQNISLLGFQTGLLSLDGSKMPWNEFRSALNQNSILLPDHPLLYDELRNLKDFGKKIDHLRAKSKDLADAVVGSFYSAFQGAFKEVSSQNVTSCLLNAKTDTRKSIFIQEADKMVLEARLAKPVALSRGVY